METRSMTLAQVVQHLFLADTLISSLPPLDQVLSEMDRLELSDSVTDRPIPAAFYLLRPVINAAAEMQRISWEVRRNTGDTSPEVELQINPRR